MQRIGYARADAPGRSAGPKILHVDNGAADTRALFGMHCLDPRNGIAIRREGDSFKGVRGEKRIDDVVERCSGLWLLRGFKAALDVLFRARIVLRESVA